MPSNLCLYVLVSEFFSTEEHKNIKADNNALKIMLLCSYFLR